jgi:hypothetical protein
MSFVLVDLVTECAGHQVVIVDQLAGGLIAGFSDLLSAFSHQKPIIILFPTNSFLFVPQNRIPNLQSTINNHKSSIPNSPTCGILPAALQLGRPFQGIVLITTEACPMETRSGFFIARRGPSARKSRYQPAMG